MSSVRRSAILDMWLTFLSWHLPVRASRLDILGDEGFHFGRDAERLADALAGVGAGPERGDEAEGLAALRCELGVLLQTLESSGHRLDGGLWRARRERRDSLHGVGQRHDRQIRLPQVTGRHLA